MLVCSMNTVLALRGAASNRLFSVSPIEQLEGAVLEQLNTGQDAFSLMCSDLTYSLENKSGK